MKKFFFLFTFLFVLISGVFALEPVPGFEEIRKSAELKPTVIFFHASWCPTCRIALKDLEEKKGDWEEHVAVFLADYDKERELKRLFSVARQHTWVQVGADGSVIQTWNGGGTGQLLQRTAGKDG